MRSRNRRLRVFLTAEFQSAPLAKLFAIVFGEIQELDAGALGRFGCPDGANVDVDGFCYAMEAKRNTKDGIEIECDGRGHEKAVLAEVQEHAEIVDSEIHLCTRAACGLALAGRQASAKPQAAVKTAVPIVS